MSKIMAVNAGSSSLKFQLLKMPSEEVITSGVIERIGLEDSIFTIKFNGEKNKVVSKIENHSVAVEMLLEKMIELKIVSSLDEICGVGHRVVHGGEVFSDSVLITDEVIEAITTVSDLAPLHNPANLVGINAFKEALPKISQVAVFDTAFHQTMNKEAFIYPVPYEWYDNYGVRKYGFHGTSHKFVSLRAAEILDKKPEDINVIVCHIGNGASLCAVKGGKSVDTTMGLTPLAGIPMGTRSGDIDPAIIEFICNKENRNVNDVITDLNKKSGYLGISGVSSDSRDIDEGVKEGNERCKLVLDIQSKRIADYIASYYVYMGGADAIVFTAGIGENSKETREEIANRLEALGVKIDKEANNVRGEERIISTNDSKIKLMLIPTNEEVMIARDTYKFL